MQTKQEFSAGGVVYKQVDQTFLFLLGKHSGYHKWVLPKGMIEAGETPEETAVRETEEEMGVTGRIVQPEPIHIEQYQYLAQLKNKENIKAQISNLKSQTFASKTDQSTRRVVKYQESGGEGTLVRKNVTFYLMEWVSGDPKDHGWEMEDAGWFNYEEAFKMMSFEGEKKALSIANSLLSPKV